MSSMPLLGCLDEKSAGAYLLRPTVKSKKKKKKKNQADDKIEKIALATAERAIGVERALLQRQLQSGDLGGGWNPFDQMIDHNS